MLNKIANYINQNGLCLKQSPIIVGFSGGADSVCLLYILNRLGYNCIAAHCNFTLRGSESDRDEAFATAFCKEHNIKAETIHFATAEYAKQNKLSIEMAARELRYTWFAQLKEQYNAQSIAIAHHSDDAIETFFINLSLGTGLAGLCSIKPLSGDIIRPLLCVSRNEIEDFLKQNNLDYITDSTNKENDFLRNKFRNIILPQIEKARPTYRKTILSTIDNLNSAYLVYQTAINNIINIAISKANNEEILDTKLLPSDPSTISCVLHEWLKGKGFTPTNIRQLANNINAEGGKMFLSKHYTLRRQKHYWVLSASNQ